jgi:hypothetical protein
MAPIWLHFVVIVTSEPLNTQPQFQGKISVTLYLKHFKCKFCGQERDTDEYSVDTFWRYILWKIMIESTCDKCGEIAKTQFEQ